MSSIYKEKTTADNMLKFGFNFDYSGAQVAIEMTINCPLTDPQKNTSPPPPPTSKSTPKTYDWGTARTLSFNLKSSAGYNVMGTATLMPFSLGSSSDDVVVWLDVTYGENMFRRFEGTAVTFQSQL